MKHILLLSVAFGALFLIAACGTPPDYPIAPDQLEGKTESEMRTMFENQGWTVEFQLRSQVTKEKSFQFIEYGQITDAQKHAYVLISSRLIDEDKFFEPVDLEYDGPRLDEKYFATDVWPLYNEQDGEWIGGGGAFDVTYTPGYYHSEGGSCIDGDTTVFGYPDDIRTKIGSRTPSTRYLNIDTPETYPPGEEEEWGFPATDFVCETLSESEEVVLQTDPGDSLTGNHGRLLAWIWYIPEGEEAYELLNYNIVRQGLGTVEYEFGAGETGDTAYEGKNYNAWMHQAEALAIEEERGMHHPDLFDPYWDYDTDAPK